ncbi:MAG TPA: hypothetical protein VH143_04730 [Kofleriaceae bacterium]|jgi:hypothetical protein|nr:hypothetical protein [Kofleriaceae bacterium]
MLQTILESALLVGLYLYDRPERDTKRLARATWWFGFVGALALLVTAPL